MRQISPRECEQWIDLARRYGFTSDDGSINFGEFVYEEGEPPVWRFITPIRATDYTPNLQRKTPPILFDRTPTGEILLPGRLVQHVFARFAAKLEDAAANTSDDMRGMAWQAARTLPPGDVLFPADTETFLLGAQDHEGNVIAYEVLPPGPTIALRVSEG
jgi:hypothetical protein